MKKREKSISTIISVVIALSILAMIFITLTGCVETTVVAVNVDSEGSAEMTNVTLGKSAMVRIGDGLWYDTHSKIVYWWNGCLNGQHSTTPTPYYSPNGFLYKYNPETNTFKELNDAKQKGEKE